MKMKKLLSVAFLVCLYILIPTITFCQRKPQIYALVVGISKYQDAQIGNLSFAKKDALEFYEFLKSNAGGAISEVNISLLTDEKATRSEVLKSLRNITLRSTSEDMVIFYFSGHGIQDSHEKAGYLLSYDTERNNEPGSAIGMNEITNRLEPDDAKVKVSYIDACHAGMFKNNGTKGINENIAFYKELANATKTSLYFVASGPNEDSKESAELGNGVFTRYLLTGLKGEADKSQPGAKGFNDGRVTATELDIFLKLNVWKATNYAQKPEIYGMHDDDFVLSVVKEGLQLSGEIGKVKSNPQQPLPQVKEQLNNTPENKDQANKKPCYECNGNKTISAQVACTSCNGSGYAKCGECNGTGKSPNIYPTRGIYTPGSRCPICAGTGNSGKCSTCLGKKEISITKTCPTCNGTGYNLVSKVKG
jgi:hypothetical protein